jgi:methyl-accepting chemotaxis protein
MVFGIFSAGASKAAAFTDHATLAAFSKSQAIIEFSMDGTILTANANFLATMGYDLQEVVGKHHRIFVDPSYATTAAYSQFWDRLRSGTFDTAVYKRIGKGGKEVWIQASYNPVLGMDGKPTKMVKIASDVTAQKLADADAHGQLAAISKSQAVIEFNMQGEILKANENFCQAMGYRPDEIVGRHHRMFVESAYASSEEYREFWERLGKGDFQSGERLRIGKGGNHVWIQATYNPIFDLNGKPFKVVKYASDITARKSAVTMLGRGLTKLAEGDLTSQIETKFADELDLVRTAFNYTVSRFSAIVGQLRETSGSLKTATEEILSGASNLANRTAKQAVAIEETSSAMEKLGTTVMENAKRAEQANGKAQSVSDTAGQTGEVMKKSNEAMERISSSSAKISKIIGLIDDIAFQTNLLALNASVEAARAGDAGKGFAVVAVEVRRLAQSAASASSEVKTLIEQSATEVTAGSKLVAEATQQLTQMLGSVHESAELIKGISSASREQSTAIAEVSSAIQQMDEMTQHNAALVEETNAAIEKTEGQANELDRIVEVFVVDAPQRAVASSGRVAPQPTSVRAQQAKVLTAAKSYLSNGNAAVKEDWNEF